MYPKGQHADPHVGRLSSSRIVFTVASGSAVAFCSCKLHAIGLITEQSDPLGQQMAELESSRLIQVDDEGQQKFDGSFESPQRANELGQASASRAKSPKDGFGMTTIARAAVDEAPKKIR
ncbi:hypothetical protein VTN00DRAFT_804 [Thermoascus crustaceus]|uniref:uncharacterized protein n=1 Tax=Thermoascus crustaceus TaxID=5088 RepID=UPI0037437D26